VIDPDIRGKRVLVLEDQLVNQTVIQKQLQKLDVACTLVADGVKGLEILEKESFDLILCDCSMPVMNGYDFTRALRKREKAAHHIRVPVLALTANAFREDVDRCLEAGMDDFISKPVTMNRLSAMLTKWLRPVIAQSSPVSAVVTGMPITMPAEISSTAIDFAALQEIIGGDDPETLDLVLAAFLATARTSLTDIEEAISDGDPKRIKAATHGAKGDARNAAATALAKLYAELESKNKEGDRAASHALTLLAGAEVVRVEGVIREHLKLRSLASKIDLDALGKSWGRS
jgi:CheY-like chemotaxis protein